MSPRRIQRRRTRGWRMPNDVVYVGRGSRWGNQFIVGRTYLISTFGRALEHIGFHQQIDPQPFTPTSRADVVEMYLAWFQGNLVVPLYEPYSRTIPRQEDIQADLMGRDLACWCPLDEPCHADVLLALAAGKPLYSMTLAELSPVVESEGGMLL
ncbi:DUF4326 domain-containing protein [Actinomyces sp. MRS3W]|uniref:DUF4326 domain-containing protein n=1 Tax=Actinomyces sp. MRS3W TaxID=2800796 RepID=UPI0028FDAE10|nr:DUF4326 domain-containing protein [Actinomyces sp. MRS3W]MDU0348316.1 DUF4326 domain-containing protein [Actinomyces sp. MRS3W]